MSEGTLRLPIRPTPARGARKRRRGRITFLVIVVLVALTGAGAWAWWNGTVGPMTIREHCTAIASGSAAELDPEQAGNAAIIAAVVTSRGLPGRATSIAIATAMQESKLRNLAYGDLDSLGLFQQRPSQGWGSREQISDPVYATNAFLNQLVKVKGYETMSIAKVAQKVQHSAFPAAYANHEPEARVIASTLTGYSPAGFSCVLKSSQAAPQAAGASGLTARARALRSAATKETGHSTSTVVSATTLRYSLPTSTGDRVGWALASWAVARTASLDVARVQVADRVWSRAHSTDGWTSVTAGTALADGTVIVQVA